MNWLHNMLSMRNYKFFSAANFTDILLYSLQHVRRRGNVPVGKESMNESFPRSLEKFARQMQRKLTMLHIRHANLCRVMKKKTKKSLHLH